MMQTNVGIRFAIIAGFALLPSATALAGETTRQSAVTALAIAPDNNGFIQGSQAGVRYRSLDGKKQHDIPTRLDHIHDIAFAPNGKILAVAGGFPAESGVVELWSWPESKLLGRLEGHKDVVYAVVWLNDAKLATGSADRTVGLWNVTQQKKVAALTGHSGPVLALAVTPDGENLCSASADHTIRVWKTSDGKLVRSLTNHLDRVRRIAFRPPSEEGQIPYLASAGADKTIRIWQPTIGRMVRIIRHDAPLTAVVWSRDGKRLFSVAEDGRLRVIDGDSDEILSTRNLSRSRIGALAISPDGEKLIAGNADGAIIEQAIHPQK